MKGAKACRECRISKRKCFNSTNSLQETCVPCQRRNITCSKSRKPSTNRTIVPTSTYGQDTSGAADKLLTLPPEAISEFIDLYMRFVHDRPHSLFHEKTLWNDFRAGSIADSLLAAICAMGCRFSDNSNWRILAADFKTKSSSLFSQQLETVSLANVQTCILLANYYAADQNNGLEALYFGIANRMAHVLRLHETHHTDPPILREVKCRVWWALFMADRWCPPGLGLPREIASSGHQLDLPMDEVDFQQMDPTAQVAPQARSEGLWKYNITLADILGPIQDLNHSLVRHVHSRHEVNQRVAHLARRLQIWHDTLPKHMAMSDENFDAYRRKGHGGTFVALHLGYHHYSTLLYFHYLDVSVTPTAEARSYASMCRLHALSFSKILQQARQKSDCHVVYLTVAHMTMVSSSVLLHVLLFGDVDEVATAREQLTSNFEALVGLRNYWPHMDKITQRLLTFQNACLKSTNSETHKVDRWMVRFLLEHALPLQEKGLTSRDETTSRSSSPLTLSCNISADRTNMISEAFADLYR